jgi:hypothetical protein
MRLTTKFAALLASVSLAGCLDTTAPAAPDPATPPENAAISTLDDPYGLTAMMRVISLDPPRRHVRVNDDIDVRFVGKAVYAHSAPVMPISKVGRGSVRTDNIRSGGAPRPAMLRVVNAATGNDFLVTVSGRLLDLINAEGLRAGINRATEGVSDPLAAERPPAPTTSAFDLTDPGHIGAASWSNGIDTRIIWSPTTAWPRRTITQLTYGSGNDSRC